MTEKTIEELMRSRGLGEVIADVESVSGGFMHRMYKVTAESGVYAVKHLNAEIMKRPDARDNFARAEKLEGILESHNIPLVPAMVIGGKKMQRVDDQYFYIFRWQEGRITDWSHISDEMCYKAGNILGRIHGIEPKITEHQPVKTSRVDWHGYARRAKEENAEIGPILAENEELLVYAERELNKARASLPDMLCISDEDMDPKNIMWDHGNPWVIDLECLDYGNPVSHVMQLALQWAGIVSRKLSAEKLTAFFHGYLEAYDNGFRSYGDVVGVAYTWIEWLEYNIQRALGNCVDEEERQTGIAQVRYTIDRIQYIRRMEGQIRGIFDRWVK